MIGQELILFFNQDKASLTIDKTLDFNQVAISDKPILFNSPAYWKIKVLNYRTLKNMIFVDVLSYHIGEVEFPRNQILIKDKLNTIEKIQFKSIDTGGLLSTQKGNIQHPIKSSIINTSENKVKQYAKQDFDFKTLSNKEINYIPIKQTIKETFFVPFKNVRFILGGITFDKKFKESEESIQITIHNDDIREEFDAVKTYFSNVLHTKKIEVTVHIELMDSKVTLINVFSPEINKINKELIDNIKLEFVKKLIKNKNHNEIDRSLFTIEDYFENFSDEKLNSKTFYSNEKDFFDDIIDISRTKHFKHLKFLSGKHLHQIMKLRFVHKPFSFIFLLAGERNYHIIWETIDTKEATYIWHYKKDKLILKEAVRNLEDIISMIKNQGKNDYINSVKDPFKRIYHDYSENIDGFLKWKGELENFLT